MRAILFNTEAQAKEVSSIEAINRGCSGTTTEWWPVIAYEESFAVLIGNDTLAEDSEFTVVDIEPTTQPGPY